MITIETPKFRFQPRIIASQNEDIRYKGSSGGIITHITKYLFESTQINTAVSFRFTGVELFKPYLIYNFDQYNQTGSIYHEINIYNFLLDNLSAIKSPLLVTCLPCQAKPVRVLCKRFNIEVILISLVCSTQLEKQATYYFLKNNSINVSDLDEFRYRGNGWPSGIEAKVFGKAHFFKNNNSKWQDIFHSQIFSMTRCLFCTNTFGENADLSVADPWLKRYIKNDKIGSSIVIAHSDLGNTLISSMLLENHLRLIENLSIDETILSQKDTLIRKVIFRKYSKLVLFMVKLIRTDFYKKYFFRISSLHNFILYKILGILKRIEGLK